MMQTSASVRGTDARHGTPGTISRVGSGGTKGAGGIYCPATSCSVSRNTSHATRHILSDVSRVASRDSSRAMATMQDLYTALCEEEGIYSFFKTLEGAF